MRKDLYLDFKKKKAIAFKFYKIRERFPDNLEAPFTQHWNMAAPFLWNEPRL